MMSGLSSMRQIAPRTAATRTRTAAKGYTTPRPLASTKRCNTRFLLEICAAICYRAGMFNRTLIPMLLCGLCCAAESFENLPVGGISSLRLDAGTLSADPGNAAIIAQYARSGKQALHLLGGQKKAVRISFKSPLTNDTQVAFWLQRWTKRAPFDFRLVAVTPKGEVELKKIERMDVGGYRDHVQALIPAGATALLMTCTSHDQGGALVDDLELFSGPMKLQSAGMVNPGAFPMLKRAPINPVMGYKVETSGAIAPQKVQAVKLRVTPSSSVSEVTLRTGSPDGTGFAGSVVFGKGKPAADGSVTIECSGELKPGTNWLWVDAAPSASSSVGSTVTFENMGMVINGKQQAPEGSPVTQSIGYLVSVPDEAVGNQPNGAEPRKCVSFRIPGLIRTASGALVGCFDARYLHSADLCADIDVAVVRSEDGGQTWTAPEVGMDAGPGVSNGCGDPCILQDGKTGRIWMQALACHFSGGASLWTSKTGFDPASTGQWEMVYSDDDGKTWSKEHVNPTRQIKKQEWTTILAGPGNGIYTRDGVIVFPAQIWDRAANPRCMSTICYSTDNGKTWKYGNGVPHSTSECQVVELQDGAIMINCRNEARQGNRIVYVTRDFGKTWEPHPTNNNTLREPTCQASIISVDSPKYGKLLLFSNPKSGGRNHMTIRVSTDDGKTWSKGYEYDIRGCWGYSSIAMADDDTVGIFYETAHVTETSNLHGIGFVRIPLDVIMQAE